MIEEGRSVPPPTKLILNGVLEIIIIVKLPEINLIFENLLQSGNVF